MDSNTRKARDAQQARNPLRYVVIQADACAQTAFALPMQSTMTHGTDRYLKYLSTKNWVCMASGLVVQKQKNVVRCKSPYAALFRCT